MHPLKKILSEDYAPESSSKYMTTIYHYFCRKINIFRLFKVKNELYQNAPNYTI